jgi:transposase-like protein
LEFEKWFSTQEACLDYAVKLRWPDGPTCPHCQGKTFWKYASTWKCSGCRKNLRVLAGTLFQDTHLPLSTWFKAVWHIVNQKFGTSALELKRVLDIRYPTSQTLLNKLRRAMVRSSRENLAGVVEVDETYYGGGAEGKPGRSADNKALIVLAVEVNGSLLGRTRMKVIQSASSKELVGFVKENIEEGSTVITDGSRGYCRLSSIGYKHSIQPVNEGSNALPHVHRIISLLKRWILGTLQGAVSHKNLGFYLDEYTFRFNSRKSGSCGKLFIRLIEQAVTLEPVTWSEIAGNDPET